MTCWYSIFCSQRNLHSLLKKVCHQFDIFFSLLYVDGRVKIAKIGEVGAERFNRVRLAIAYLRHLN